MIGIPIYIYICLQIYLYKKQNKSRQRRVGQLVINKYDRTIQNNIQLNINTRITFAKY